MNYIAVISYQNKKKWIKTGIKYDGHFNNLIIYDIFIEVNCIPKASRNNLSGIYSKFVKITTNLLINTIWVAFVFDFHIKILKMAGHGILTTQSLWRFNNKRLVEWNLRMYSLDSEARR